jgi:probable phosphoglycerate mutase
MNLQDYKDGTQVSGFVHGGENKPPRQCGNCIWMGLESCGHPKVVIDPEVPKNDIDRGVVDEDDCCDGFQSRGNAVLYCIRHGDTEFNQKNAFRGWINVPLNEKGRKHAKVAGKYLKDYNIKTVYTSDLDRAVETAKLAFPGAKAVKDKRLRPWDVGVFTGKDRDQNQEKLNYYIDHADEEIPDGESLRAFSLRMKKAFEQYVQEGLEDGPIAVVFHSSNIIQFEKIAEGKDELGRPEDVELVLPGGILSILEEKGVYKAEPIFCDKGSANYGS